MIRSPEVLTFTTLTSKKSIHIKKESIVAVLDEIYYISQNEKVQCSIIFLDSGASFTVKETKEQVMKEWL